MELHITIEEWRLVLRRNSNDYGSAVQMRAYFKTLAAKMLMRSVSMLGSIKLMMTGRQKRNSNVNRSELIPLRNRWCETCRLATQADMVKEPPSLREKFTRCLHDSVASRDLLRVQRGSAGSNWHPATSEPFDERAARMKCHWRAFF